MKKLVAIFAVMLGFTSVSQAGILVEPYLGYEMGTTKNSSGKLEGTDIGLRLAYKAPLMFWAGVDATMGNLKSKPDAGGDDDVKRTTVYGVVGLEFPILVRGWVGYGLSNELKYDTANVKAKATAYKVGLGFTGLPFVSLNFEYVNEKVTDIGGFSTTSPEPTNDAYILSVSLPWVF